MSAPHSLANISENFVKANKQQQQQKNHEYPNP